MEQIQGRKQCSHCSLAFLYCRSVLPGHQKREINTLPGVTCLGEHKEGYPAAPVSCLGMALGTAHVLSWSFHGKEQRLRGRQQDKDKEFPAGRHLSRCIERCVSPCVR